MLRSIKKWAAKRREARRQYRPGIWIERDVKLFNCKLSPGIRVGYASYANDSMIRSGVTIGRYCSIGRRCTLGAATHPLNWVSTHPIVFNGIPPEILPTEIGNDVWLGDNVIIMPGLSIGDGAVIGAGCVVTKSVPPYAVIAGVPGRVLRNRFPDDLAARSWRASTPPNPLAPSPFWRNASRRR